jgi:hypothetical protein
LLDPASVACLVVEEQVAKPGPVPASFVKSYELVTKRPDLPAPTSMSTGREACARTRADERNFLAGDLPFVITTERRTFPRVGLVAQHGSLLGSF